MVRHRLPRHRRRTDPRDGRELPYGARVAAAAYQPVRRARAVPGGVHGGVARGPVPVTYPGWHPSCRGAACCAPTTRLDVPRLKPGLGTTLPLRAALRRAHPSGWECRVAAVFIAALAGCHPAAARGVTLDFWGLGREGEVVAELMPAFELENPGIRVRVQQIPWTAAHEKLLTAYVGNATPDVAQLGNTWVPEFVALDGLVRLDSLIAASATVHPADYFSGIWSTNVLDGGVYGVPWYVDTRLLFYRKDLLAHAGFPNPPTSWREWLAAMRAMKGQGGPDRYPMVIPTNGWPPPTILGLQAGSPILRDGARYGAFTEPPFRRAFDFYLSLYRTGLAPRLGINEIGNIYQEFGRGTVAMWITGPWNVGEFRRRLPPDFRDKWGAAPMPGPAGQATRAFWEQLQRVVPTPQVPEWELIAPRIFDYGEQAIRGGAPADTVLARLDAEVNRILERRRWLLARRGRP